MKNHLLLKSIFLLGLIFMFKFSVLAQEWRLEKSLNFKQIQHLALDVDQNIFLSQSNGNIIKLDSTGNQIALFSPSRVGRIGSIEIWSRFKVVVFYESIQEVLVLDRFLTETSRISLMKFDVGFVSNVALNFQQNLWLVDESDFSLKLFDINTKDLLLVQPLFQFLDVDHHEIKCVREYQNNLYVHDKYAGVLVFDNLGNFIEKMNTRTQGAVGFDANEMYWVENGYLRFQNLYHGESRELMIDSKVYEFSLYKRGYLYRALDSRLDIYRYLSEE